MRAFAVAAVILTAVSLSGCGSGGTTAGPTTAGPTNSTTVAPTLNIVQTAQGNDDLSTLVTELTASPGDLVTTLSGTGPFTVFAPTNEAFDALQALPTGEALKDVLLAHVHSGAAFSGDLSDGQVVSTLFGDGITVGIADGVVTLTSTGGVTATVTIPNVACTNGVVHIIDKVLVPADLPTAGPTTAGPTTAGPTTAGPTTAGPTLNIVQTAQGNDDLSQLVTELTASPGDLVTTLSGTGPFTVFAPTNEAFAALTAAPTGDALKDVLLAHVHSGAAFSTDLSDGQVVATLFGDGITVGIADGVVTLTSTGGVTATVTIPNVACTNGVVHVIDQVLVPAGLPTTTAAPIISV